MSEIVDRVARALYEERMRIWSLSSPSTVPDFTWETDNESYRDQLRAEARLAILAMYEPTYSMERSAYEGKGHGDYLEAGETWRRMITETLK